MSRARSTTAQDAPTATSESAPGPALAGLAQLRAGFCFTPEQDRDFALGWPHLTRVQPVLLEDEDPIGSATRILKQLDVLPRAVWPRRTAMALVRAWGQTVIFDLAPGITELREEAHVAIWNARPIDATEAAALIQTRMMGGVAGVGESVPEIFVLLLEAFVGAEVVADAIIDVLEAMSPGQLLGGWALPPRVTFTLGALLLRVPPVKAQRFRERLERVLSKVNLAGGPLRELRLPRSENSHARSVHLALHGALAADSCTDRSPGWLVYAGDDPNFIQMRVSLHRGPWLPDSRLVWLAGPAVLPSFDKAWSSLRTPLEQAWFFEQLAPIRHPDVVRIALRMSASSLIRPKAMEWLAAHAELARPVLSAQIDQRTALASPARAALDKLDAG